MHSSWEFKVPPPNAIPPQEINPLIFGLLKGNQWVAIVPDHKAGGLSRRDSFGGVTFNSHDFLLVGEDFPPKMLTKNHNFGEVAFPPDGHQPRDRSGFLQIFVGLRKS